MRITVIINKFNLSGGGENHDIFMKMMALKNRGHEVVIVTTFSKFNNISEDLPLELIEEYAPEYDFFASQKFIINILNKYSSRTDVFYIVGSAFIFGVGWYCLKNESIRKRVVADINGYANFVQDYYRKEPLYPVFYIEHKKSIYKSIKHKVRVFLDRYFVVYLMNKLDKIIIISQATSSYYVCAGVKKEKIVIIPSFHDIQTLQETPVLKNPFCNYPPDSIHILSVGRLDIDKGVDILIKAFSILRMPEVFLHIIGEGPEKNILKQKVEEMNIKDSIIFYTWRQPNDLVPFYQHANLFVYPARLPEAMVRVTVEAMACGRPLVIPDISVEDWNSVGVAKVFHKGDSLDLVQKIKDALNDSFFQKNAFIIGQKKAQEFDFRNLVIRLENILK